MDGGQEITRQHRRPHFRLQHEAGGVVDGLAFPRSARTQGNRSIAKLAGGDGAYEADVLGGEPESGAGPAAVKQGRR